MKLSQNVCLDKISDELENGSCPIIMKFGQNICLNEISNEFENGSCRVKNRSLGQILRKPCVRHIFSPIIMKHGQNVFFFFFFFFMKSRTCLKMGLVGPKTRSLAQILEKPCVRSRGHIFSPIIIKLGQNLCLDQISDELEIGSCRIKT